MAPGFRPHQALSGEYKLNSSSSLSRIVDSLVQYAVCSAVGLSCNICVREQAAGKRYFLIDGATVSPCSKSCSRGRKVARQHMVRPHQVSMQAAWALIPFFCRDLIQS